MSEADGMCREVGENMSDIIEGVAHADLYEHVASCERCRDARYDAEQIIRLVGDAAADYRFPEGLEARLMSELSLRGEPPTQSGVDANPNAGAMAQAGGDTPHRSASRDQNALVHVAGASAGVQLGEAALRVSTGPRPSSFGAAPERTPGVPSLRWVWLSLAAAVSLGLLWVGSRPDVNDRGSPALAVGAWQGQVVQVERAFGSPSGLSQCARGTQACRALAAGDEVRAGMRLETDGLTRALVKFADGSSLALDRATELELDPTERRRGRLVRGNLVAEIERLTGPASAGARALDAPSHAVIDVPAGRAEVLGTKFALRATDAGSRVEVSRGVVKLIDARDRVLSVQAGEAGQIGGGAEPKLETVLDLGQAFGWSAEAFEEKHEPVEHGALGELLAKRPQDATEKSGAVSLIEHHIKIRIVDNIARTEIEEVFSNQTDDVLEGIYRFPLPPGAQIERLALEVDGKLEEGAFVDRERAAAIWRGAVVNAGGKKPPPVEEIIWVPGPWRDPALLEWQRGNRFELRIFPIGKRASRRIVLAYTEVLGPSEGGRRYVYPLPRDPRGTTRIARFTAEAQVRGHDVTAGVEARGYPLKTLSGSPEVARLAFDANDFAPSGDLVLSYRLGNTDAELRTWAYQPRVGPAQPPVIGRATAPKDGPYGTLPGGARPSSSSATAFDVLGLPDDAPYVAIALRPNLPRRAKYEPRDYVLVADTSRSMIGESYRRAVAVVEGLIRELDRTDRFTLLACDSTCQSLPGGYLTPGDEKAAVAAEFLRNIEPEGASDLAFAVEQAAALRERNSERSLRIIYVGDGTPTVGPIHPALLKRAVSLALPRGASLNAVAVGSDADQAALRVLTRAGGGVSVAFTPGQSVRDVVYALLGATYGHALEQARLSLPEGMVAVVPRDLGSIAAGSEELIVARLTSSRVQGEAVLRGQVAGEEFEQRYPIEVVANLGEGNAFVPRLYAALAISELEGSMDESARRRSIELSTRFSVASRYTSLLVLESPAMFKAFGLDNQRSVPEWSGELESQKAETWGAAPADAYAADGAATEGGVGNASGGRAAAKSSSSRRSLGRASAPLDGSDKDSSFELGFPEQSMAEPKKAMPASPGSARAERERSLPGWGVDDELPPPAIGGPRLYPMPPPMAPPMPPPMLPRRMIPMRRVWDRVGQIDVAPGAFDFAAASSRTSLEARVRERAQSREALKELYVFDFLAGDLERAAESAELWSEKDPLDVDALTARADLAAQRGHRDLAIRILGSVVDVRPGDYKAQWRLARLHRWAGRPERGCRHSLAVAQLMLRDAKLVSEAVGCSRDVGQEAWAEDLLAALEPGVRQEVQRLQADRRPSDELSGDVSVQATWQGSEHDVDVVLIHPEGYRVSWLGAPTRSVISARDVLSVHREGLALRGADPGRYAVELVRSSGTEGTIRGSVQIHVANREQTIPFVLDGDRQRVAIANLRMQSRLVPVNGSDVAPRRPSARGFVE